MQKKTKNYYTRIPSGHFLTAKLCLAVLASKYFQHVLNKVVTCNIWCAYYIYINFKLRLPKELKEIPPGEPPFFNAMRYEIQSVSQQSKMPM